MKTTVKQKITHLIKFEYHIKGPGYRIRFRVRELRNRVRKSKAMYGYFLAKVDVCYCSYKRKRVKSGKHNYALPVWGIVGYRLRKIMQTYYGMYVNKFIVSELKFKR